MVNRSKCECAFSRPNCCANRRGWIELGFGDPQLDPRGCCCFGGEGFWVFFPGRCFFLIWLRVFCVLDLAQIFW